MAKQLNVNLAFTADTKAAQQQLQQLQRQLDLVMTPKGVDLSNGLTAEIKKGVAAAAELKVKLLEATNVNTGKLDLTKFSQSLKTSNRQLEDYARDLAALGPQGTEAFLSIARAISNAETPFIRLGARANEFLTTLKNTARWQISSSILHGFIGTLQHAYGYAQDLNKSLNNIRIVTGKSAEDMARFAKEANAAAKGLSATTLDYTDASLIYYQQGLDDQAVKARTDVTIKLANVSRQSAEEVSDQMTAIWNNFAKGSENLEYYADVITALGAATASSSEEISTGLEKFAAVANTVGLSYEYATSALATITATTRQSADTVGTGLRTLFARLEGLKLGETLEDGVDLNKYSKALESIGVDIFDVNGEIKNMDTILNETAAGWDTLSKAQQIAFAQTVGGVRQYTNLIALMDNWDFMQQNLNVAKGAKGTLQQQADIYAESWEAAQKRVKAAAEAIYDALLNDKFFINLTKGLATILDGINGIIKSAGGLRGVLLGLSAILSKVFSASMAKSISSMAASISSLRSGKTEAIETKNKAWNLAAESVKDDGTMLGQARYENIQRESELQQKLINNAHSLSEEERKIYQNRLDIIRTYQEEYEAQGAILDKLQEQEGVLLRQARAKVRASGGNEQKFTDYIKANRNLGTTTEQLVPLQKFLSSINISTEEEIHNLQELQDKLSTISPEGAALLSQKMEDLKNNTGFSEAAIRKLVTEIDTQLQEAYDNVENLGREFGDKLPPAIERAGEAARNTAAQEERFNQAGQNTVNIARTLGGELPNLTSKYEQLGQAIAQTVQLMSSIGFAINGIVNFINNLKEALEDGEITLEEFGMIMTSLSMVFMSLMGTFKAGKELLPLLGVSFKAVEGSIISTEIAAAGLTFTLGQLLLVLGAIIAIGAGLYYVFNKDEIAAKKAAKEHEKLAEAADKAHQEFVSLKADLENYDNALETLKNATKNTEEWAEAARAVNDAFDQLKENHPDIMEKAKYGFENGQLVITNMDELIAEAEQADKKASQNSLVSGYKASTARYNADRQKSYRNEFGALYNNGMSNSDVNELIDQILEGDLSQIDIRGKVEAYILKNGLDAVTGGNILYALTNDNGRTTLGKLANDRAGQSFDRLNAARQLAYEVGGPGLTNESYDRIIDEILKTNTNQSDEDFIKAVQTAVRGLNLVKIPEDNFLVNGQTVDVGGQLAEIEDLRKALSDENSTAETFFASGINWEALGTDLVNFVALSTEQQEHLLTTYELNLERARLDAEEARANALEGEEKEQALQKVAIDRQLLEKKGLNDLAKAHDLDAEKVENLAKYYQDYAGEVDGISEDLKDNIAASNDLAIIHNRMNKGLEDLNKNWKEYKEILDEGNVNSEEYQRTISNLREHLNDILGIDLASLNDDFITSAENLALIEQAANGDTEALTRLAEAAAAQIFINYTTNADFVQQDFMNLLDRLRILTANEDFKIGARIDDTAFIASCNNIIAAAGMTAEQAAEAFKALGYNVEITTVKRTTYSHSEIAQLFDGMTGSADAENIRKEQRNLNRLNKSSATTTIEIPVVKALTYKGSFGGTVNTKSLSGDSGGGGGGGGSEKKTKDEGDMDRYHYIKETIEDLETAYSRASKEKDRLFGADRVSAINDEIKAIDNLIKEQDIYLASIDEYLDKDTKNLIAKVQTYTGIAPELDDVGRIINYDAIMAAAIKKYNSDTSDEADDNWSDFENSISTYEGTKNLREEQRERRADLVREKQDKFFERLDYVVDLKLKVNEADKKRIETDIKMLGDSVYKAAERLDLLWSTTGDHQKGEDGLANTFGNINDTLETYNFELGENQRLKDAGLISDDQYYKNLEKARDGLYDQLNALLDLDEAMRTYYSTTLNDALQELEFWNKQIEHGTTVLEHYQKLLELTGHASDYESMEAVLRGQEHTQRNQYKAAKRELEELKEQQASIEKQILDAQAAGDNERLIFLQDKFKAIEEAIVEAEDNYYERLIKWNEVASALADTVANKIHKEFEDALTDGLGFDYINSDIEKLTKIQDNYLTKTEQIYETTSFLRRIQNDMDKTDSVAQKQKLKNFQAMVERMKEQGELSKVDLEIAKRKYEVELAQMALEDARNAKSVVRLSRDSEGNYGYVYSADPDKIDDAEQKLLDKQYDLYQYAKETYQNNIKELFALKQQQDEELEALYKEYYDKNLLDSVEYQEKQKEIIERYGALENAITGNIYSTRQVLTDVAFEDYSKSYYGHYDGMAKKLEDWETFSIDEVKKVESARKEATDAAHREVEQVLGPDFETLEERIEDVTDRNDEWTKATLEEVIPALDDQVEHADAVTDAYARQRDAIQQVIDKIYKQIAAIDALYAKKAQEAQKEYEDEVQQELSPSPKSQEPPREKEKEEKPPTTNNGIPAVGDVVTYNSGNYTADSYGGGTYGSYHRGEKVKISIITDTKRARPYHITTLNGSPLGWVSLEQISGYDTGGYTGEWNSSGGRLALLHEKELVLNAEDTENMLKAIDIIREITGMIDLNAVSAAAGMGYINSPSLGTQDQTLDQNVHIEANFPSVTDHTEIEEALTTLVNRAAQFANRR